MYLQFYTYFCCGIFKYTFCYGFIVDVNNNIHFISQFECIGKYFHDITTLQINWLKY